MLDRLTRFADRLVLLWGWRRALVAVGAGAASALSLPPFDALPVNWITVPVLILLLDGAIGRPGASRLRRLLPPFVVGWCFGFGYFVGGLWWIGAAFLVDAGQFAWLMPFAVIAFPAGLALFWGLGAAAASLFTRDGWTRFLAFAAMMSLAEWLRGHVLTGFPWNAFGYTLMPSPLLMQAAALVGLWGVTFVAFLVFGAPVLLVGPRPRGDRLAFTLTLLLVVADLAFGAIRLQFDDGATVPGVKLRLVQPNFAQDSTFASAPDEDIVQRYLSLSAKGMEDGKPAPFTHLVWPETAFPFFLTGHPNVLAAIGAFLPPGTTLLTGAVRAEPVPGDPEDASVYNSLYVIDDQGVIRDAYDKVHLVPFGEYLPFQPLFDALGIRQLVDLPGGFSAGHRRRTLPLPDAPAFGPLICYEAIFPGEVVDATNRPRWLVNVTNDAWFGDTPGPHQHFEQARLRAVEEGIPLARAANSGISAIIDPYGRVLSSGPLNSVAVVDGPLPKSLQPTPYSLMGDSLYYGVIIMVMIFIIFVDFQRGRRPD